MTKQQKALRDIAEKVEKIKAARRDGDSAEVDLLIVQCGHIARDAGVPFSLADIDKPAVEIEEDWDGSSEYDESDSWSSSGC